MKNQSTAKKWREKQSLRREEREDKMKSNRHKDSCNCDWCRRLNGESIEMSEEIRRKIGLSNKGKHQTDETKRKISVANKGKLPWTTGKHHSEETKEKIRISNKNHKSDCKCACCIVKRGEEPSSWKYWSEERRQSQSEIIKRKGIPNRIVFQKGCVSPMKGNHLTEESKEKLSKSIKKTFAESGFTPWNKGLTKETDERIMKVALSQIGHLALRGENHYNWQGGKSFEPYSLEFNKELKEQIRKRDNYICQECGIPQKELGYTLHCHHIDYDKKNSSLDNLISLCKSCHMQTNYSRDDWKNYFKDKLNGDS
ncbi:MAG: HNH endonuclease [Actinobacteria bacterium]|nr:HNH endonuclease [Actinomycetota bacterium]MBE3114606.1 HNH endonuclease [Actinomycetota bacterium]